VKYVLPELILQREIISGGTFFTGTYFGSHLQRSPCSTLDYDVTEEKQLNLIGIPNYSAPYHNNLI
jgi:hypothetical protein